MTPWHGGECHVWTEIGPTCLRASEHQGAPQPPEPGGLPGARSPSEPLGRNSPATPWFGPCGLQNRKEEACLMSHRVWGNVTSALGTGNRVWQQELRLGHTYLGSAFNPVHMCTASSWLLGLQNPVPGGPHPWAPFTLTRPWPTLPGCPPVGASSAPAGWGLTRALSHHGSSCPPLPARGAYLTLPHTMALGLSFWVGGKENSINTLPLCKSFLVMTG